MIGNGFYFVILSSLKYCVLSVLFIFIVYEIVRGEFMFGVDS